MSVLVTVNSFTLSNTSVASVSLRNESVKASNVRVFKFNGDRPFSVCGCRWTNDMGKVPESRNQPDSSAPFCSMFLTYPHLFKLNVFIVKDKMVGCQVDCS